MKAPELRQKLMKGAEQAVSDAILAALAREGGSAWKWAAVRRHTSS